MVRGFAVVALVVAACQFPRPADRQPDGGPDAPVDAPVDARAELVLGRWDWLHTTSEGVTARGNDLTIYSVGALVPNGSSYTSIAGVGRNDGTFELDDVPPGVTYFLRVGRLIAVTDQHEVQFGTSIPTRAATPVMSPTPFTVSLSGLSPMEALDYVMISSRLADSELSMPASFGATSINGTFDWTKHSSDYRPGALPSMAAGDDLLALQYRTTTGVAPAPTVTQIVSAGDLSTVELREGEPASVSSTLTSPSRTFDVSLPVSVSTLTAGYSPLMIRTQATVTCAALPGPAVGWSYSGHPRLGRPIMTATFREVIGTSLDPTGTYPDPYPPSWPRFCHVELRADRSFRVPGASTTRTITGGHHRVVTAAGLISSVMPPPTVIRIAGRDGDVGGLVPNTGAPVEVTWTGAAQATQFVVSAYELRVQSGPRLLAAVMTRDTRVELPPELLSGADFIAFVIAAFSGSNDYDAGELAMDGVPGASASAVTAMFRWSATCGNGAPDLGEDCDASGASATCDADCTAAMCGDGTRNAAAGELCDSIVDTIGCDDDCTANTCGDGHHNASTEQCDDGGIAPGDGCSATCRTE